MDARRIIPIEVKDEYIIGAGRVIGAKGSHDDVVLRVAFNDMWDGTSKTAVWLNAIGEQAVVQMLLPDTKEDGAYLIPIPEEAKSEVGDAMLTIKGFTTADGATEGSATITATAYFRVLEGDFDQGASDSGSITLNQSEQFQAQLTAIEADIINAAKAADAKEAAEQFANDAEGYAADADSAAKRANAAVYEAENWAWSASDDASTAAAASGKAETAAGRAETAAGRAETAAESASDSAGRAQQDLRTIEEDLLPQTEEFSTQAQWYRDEAADAKTAAQTASTNASRSATAANTSAGDAAREAARAKSNNEDIADMIDGFGDTVEDAINRVNGVIADIDVHVEDAKAYAEGAWEAAEEAANSAGVASAKADAASTSAADAAREAARAKSNNEDIADMIDGFGDTVEAGKAEVNEVLQNIDEHVETAHSYAESAWEAAEAAEAAADRAENASGGTAGKDGEDGATFTPSVSSAGVISWTNDKGLTNPSPVNIKGAKGDKGDKGTTFTPSVSSDGTISWANDGGLTNPASVNVFDDIGLMSKNGGKMTSEDEEYETTLAPEKIRLENADSSTNEITATGIQLSVDGEEGKLITKLKQGELSFYHSLEDGEIVSGVVRGLAETTDETAAVPYGQFKAELENLSIESSGIATKKGTIVEINSNYDAPIRSVGSVDGSTINTVTVWGKNHFHRDHSASVTANGVTVTWDPKNQEFIFNGTTLAPGDMRLVNPMPLDWIVGEKYTISIRHVSGTADLGSGTGITYAWGVFLNDASSLLRGNTNNAEFVDLYSFTGTAFALPSNKTYILYFQCWRAGTVFNNYRVKIQIEKGTSVTEWEAYRGETASTSNASNLMLHKGKNFVKATPSAEISVGYTVNIGEYVNDMFSKLEERIAALEEQLNAMA